MDQKEEKLDVIIFGASGFTGKYTILEGIKLLEGLRWGVAGRSRDKVRQVLNEVEKKADKDLSEVPIVIADIKDADSLKRMAEQCKVLINCCGPYRFFGEPVIKACIEAGTHHVDVSGEPQYMEQMQLEYHQKAQDRGIYIVSACGYDSIPADMGVVFLERQFDGVVNSVESYMKLSSKIPFEGGAILHYGTWETAIFEVAHEHEMPGLRSKLFKTPVPKVRPHLKNRVLHKPSIVDGWWAVPFPGSDQSVVMRSQRHFYEVENKRPIQIETYIVFRTLLQVVGVACVGLVFKIMSRFKCGRKMLLKHPNRFSLGFCTHEGPSEKTLENAEFTIFFKAEGWDKDEQLLLDPNDRYKSRPTKKMVTKVSGTNPGYGAACVALVLCATTILREGDKMPGSGGVYPPGAAYAKTSLIEQLCKNGLTFEVVKETK